MTQAIEPTEDSVKAVLLSENVTQAKCIAWVIHHATGSEAAHRHGAWLDSGPIRNLPVKRIQLHYEVDKFGAALFGSLTGTVD